MPTPWWYWAIVATFFIVGCVAVCVGLTTTDEKENRATLLVCGLFFFIVSGGFGLYPILRRREQQGVLTEKIRTREIQCDAVLFPASRITQSFILFGSLLGAIILSVMLAQGVSDFDRGKAWVGAIAFWCFFAIAIRSTMQGRLGIVLTPEGIIWRELFGGQCFIPWSDVENCRTFMKREKYNSKGSLSLGLKLIDAPSGHMSWWQKNRLKSNQATNGWDLWYSVDTLAAPVHWAAAVIEFYHWNPQARNEIGSPAGLSRIEALGIQTSSVPTS